MPCLLVNIYSVLVELSYQKSVQLCWVWSVSRRPTKPEATVKSPASDSLAAIHEFLVRELPPENVRRAAYFANASHEAGERYVRYSERNDEWVCYATRRKKLETIATLTEKLASGLSDLDILSRDDLASRIGSKEIDGLIGSLRRLGKETTVLVEQFQPEGRGRNLVEQRWILEIANIYENAFHQPASVWGKGGGPIKGRQSFYRFLELSRSPSRKWSGKLHPRQVDRVLKRRRSA